MNEYVALRDGYTDRYIYAGEHFFWGGKKPSWAESVLSKELPVSSEKADKPSKKGK